MRRVALEALAALRDTLVITFVDPVKAGHPRPSTWPRGLPSIATATGVLYVLLGLAAVAAVQLRQGGELVVPPTSDKSLPASTIPLLLCGVILSLVLAHTAALHTSWWLRAVLFALGGSTLFFFGSFAFLEQPWSVAVSAGLYLALLVFTVFRSRRAFAWWEFVVVAALVGAALLFPWTVSSPGLDVRPLAIEGTLTGLSALTLPALMVAGSAPAQIVVTGAEAAAGRPISRRLFWLLSAVALVWLLAATVWGFVDGSVDLSASAFAGSLVVLAGIGLAVAVGLVRGRRPAPEPPQSYPDAWSPWLYPLATVIVGPMLVALPLTLVTTLLRAFGPAPIGQAGDAVWSVVFDNNPGVLWRGALGAVLLVVCWRLGGRGRIAEASVLGALSVAALADAAGLLPGLGFLHDRSTQAMGLIAAAIALVAGLALAARGRLDRRRASAVVAVVLLATLYPHRNLLDDPASAVLVFSAPLLILFGLTWRLLTGAEFTQKASRAFPQPTRVLLFLANSLFAVTALAFVALSRAAGTNVDSATVWSDAGDWMLGEPLFAAGLVAGTWLALRPAPTASEPTTPTPTASGLDSAEPRASEPSETPAQG